MQPRAQLACVSLVLLRSCRSPQRPRLLPQRLWARRRQLLPRMQHEPNALYWQMHLLHITVCVVDL